MNFLALEDCRHRHHDAADRRHSDGPPARAANWRGRRRRRCGRRRRGRRRRGRRRRRGSAGRAFNAIHEPLLAGRGGVGSEDIVYYLTRRSELLHRVAARRVYYDVVQSWRHTLRTSRSV